MSYVTIHNTGQGGDALRVDSWYNGLAYALHFGSAGHPMRTIFLQGDDATALREEVESLETRIPEMLSRDAWLQAADPYL